MLPDQQAVWRTVMTLSCQLLAAARIEDWEEACRIEPVRKDWLDRFFQHSIDLDEVDAMRRDLLQIQAWDAEAQVLLKASQKQAADLLAELKTGKQVTDAYSSYVR